LGVDNGDLYPDEQVMAEVTVCLLQDDRLWLVLGMFSFLFPLINYPWRIEVWARGVRISCSPTLSSSETLLSKQGLQSLQSWLLLLAFHSLLSSMVSASLVSLAYSNWCHPCSLSFLQFQSLVTLGTLQSAPKCFSLEFWV
jgi:hypothetical protein